MTEVRAAHAPAGLERTKLVRSRSVADACATLAAAVDKGHAAMLLAGGTDFVVDRHLMPVERAKPVDLIVDLTGVEGFHSIEDRTEGNERRLRFGGGVTYWDLRKSALVLTTIPMLDAMSRDVGAVQIQTRGTLAGNVASASPAADGVAALLALEGRIHLRSVSGARTLALAETFLAYRKTAIAPNEIIEALDVRVPSKGALVRWRKVGTRLAQAISKVALASVVETKDGSPASPIVRARFGMASVAATTHGLPAVSKFLEGKSIADASKDAAGLDAAIEADIRPIDDVRSTGEYRLHVAKALVRQALGS